MIETVRFAVKGFSEGYQNKGVKEALIVGLAVVLLHFVWERTNDELRQSRGLDN